MRTNFLKRLVNYIVHRIEVRTEIALILRERYGKYEGRVLQKTKAIHLTMREQMGDEDFLRYLRHLQKHHPRPTLAQVEEWTQEMYRSGFKPREQQIRHILNPYS